MFRMNGTPRAQGCAGAVPFSFARCLAQGCAGAASPKLARHIVMNGYVQDERYIAIEHMDVRRDCVNFAQRLTQGCAARLCQFCTAFNAGMCGAIVSILHSVFLLAGTPRWCGILFQDMP